MVLILAEILPYILRLLQRGRFERYNLNPLKWNLQQERFEVSQSYYAGYIITPILLLTSALSIFSLLTHDNISDKTVQGFFTVIEVVFASLHWFFICYSSDFVKLFNGILYFEKKYAAGYSPPEYWGKVIKVLSEFQYHTLPFVIILVSFTAAVAPTSPFNSYNLFYRSFSTNATTSSLVTTFITVWISNAGLWYLTLPVLNFVLTCNVAVSIYALNAMPWIFHRVALGIVPSGSSNCSKKGKLAGLVKATKTNSGVGECFRSLQLLCHLYNELHCGLIIQPLILSSMTSQIVYLFILVTYSSEEGILIFVFSTIVVINAAAFDIACFGEAANVYTSHIIIKKRLLSNLTFLRRNRHSVWFNRFLKSYPRLGVSFFRNTYFDTITALKMELLCVDKTANLLLLNS